MSRSGESVTKQLGLDSYCSVCVEPLPSRASTGRPRRTCSDRCRQRRRRASSSARSTTVTKPDFDQSEAPRFVTASERHLLAAIREAPGRMIPELARELGVPQNRLYRLLPGLEWEGLIEKRGRGWFPAGS
jgi:hypothetical protein